MGLRLAFGVLVQVNVARDVAVQMCDTLEGKAYTGVVNVSYMAVANEVGMCACSQGLHALIYFVHTTKCRRERIWVDTGSYI